MFCYLWVHKKYKQPYIGIVEGSRVDHPLLIQEKRARMKIMLLDSTKDVPVKEVSWILKQAKKSYELWGAAGCKLLVSGEKSILKDLSPDTSGYKLLAAGGERYVECFTLLTAFVQQPEVAFIHSSQLFNIAKRATQLIGQLFELFGLKNYW